jgi:hypothetical protein
MTIIDDNLLSIVTRAAVAGVVGAVVSVVAGCGPQVIKLNLTMPPTVPAVVEASPANSDVGVPADVNVVARFSEAMDANAITETSFTLEQGDVPVDGIVSYNAAAFTAFFDPTERLERNAVYTATITTEALDQVGTALTDAFVWTFTTTDGGFAPVVVAREPVDGAVNVPIRTTVTASFSRGLEKISVTTATFLLDNGEATISGDVALNEMTNTATFTPHEPLALNQQYTATLTSAIRDTDGSPLAGDVVWHFQTEENANRPMVFDVSPNDDAEDVSVGAVVTAMFNKAMDPRTISDLTFMVVDGDTVVPGTVSLSFPENTATFSPTEPLDTDTGYTATISTGAADISGRPLAEDFAWTFITAAPGIPPTVVDTFPNASVENVNVDTPITAAFSASMDPLSINHMTVTVTDGLRTVLGMVSFATRENVVTFNPTELLASNTDYTVLVSRDAADVDGVPLAEDFSWTFRTAFPRP